MGKPKAKQRSKTTAWDAAAYLQTDEDIAHYLEAVFEDGDATLVAAALGDIARAKGMSRVAQQAGLGRESLYKALSTDGNPEFATVLKVMRALGLKLTVAARTAVVTPKRKTNPILAARRQ
jgi:probable addiction module antidote protein